MDLTQYADEAFWLLQAVVGVIFIVHSFSKLKAPAQTAAIYGMPSFVGLLHGLVELLGGALLLLNSVTELLGIFVRGFLAVLYFNIPTVALVLAVIMLGAIYFKMFKWKVPFTAQDKTGWEFDLLLLAAAVLIAVS